MSARSSNHRVSPTLHAGRAVLIGMLLFATSAAGMPSLQAAEPGAPGSAPTYHIPGGPLSRALTRSAAAAGVLLSVDAALTDGKESPGLQGDFAVADGFAALLAGSGLAPVENADGSYTLRRVAQSEAVEPQQKGQEDPQTPSEDETILLPAITVTASPTDDTSYNVLDATTATKTDTPIMETPFSVQVAPQQVLKDQQAFRLEQALRNVSGVYAHPQGIFSGPGEDFNLRGFATNDIYRNGFRFPTGFAGTGPLETANLDRIEVLKGPASILYGRIEPGGLINLVPKQPLASPYYSLQQQFASFDFYRTTLDATGPIAKDHGLFYRFNLAYENAGSFVEFLKNERVFIAPTLRWEISPATQATFELQYKHSRRPPRLRDPRHRGPSRRFAAREQQPGRAVQ